MARLNDPTSGHERRANIGQITSNHGSQLSGAPYHGELKQHQGFIQRRADRHPRARQGRTGWRVRGARNSGPTSVRAPRPVREWSAAGRCGVSSPDAQAVRPGDEGDTGAELSYSSGPGRWVLLATVLGSGMASIDATVVGIALPVIGRDFHTGLAALQWVVTTYTLTLAGLLLVAGSLGDRYGRKRIFLIGVVWFAIASILCGIAPNAPFLIGARAVQGVGAALLTPGSLAIIEASFRPADRMKAIGAWSGLSGVAIAIGPFLGGWLVQAVSWRLIFAINLPIAVAVVAVAVRHVPESRDTAMSGMVDITGGVL